MSARRGTPVGEPTGSWLKDGKPCQPQRGFRVEHGAFTPVRVRLSKPNLYHAVCLASELLFEHTLDVTP